jgi:hypothetical protein
MWTHIQNNTNELYEEPFYFNEGISIWPTIIIRGVAIVFSLFFLIISFRSLRNNCEELARDFNVYKYLEEASHSWGKNISDCWEKRKTQLYNLWKYFVHLLTNVMSYFKAIFQNDDKIINNEVSVEYLWQQYIRKDKFGCMFWRTILLSFFYFLISKYIITTWGLPYTPARGDKIFYLYKITLFLTIVIFIFLTFYVFDAIRIFRRFVTDFYGKDPQWEETSLSQFGWQLGMSKEALGDWMLIRMVAKRSEVVGKLIYYPFIVWFMIFLARLHYFDNWRIPLGLAIVISLSAMIAWSSAFMLRRSAEGLRADLLNRLEKKLIAVLSAESLGKEKPEKKRSEYIQKVMEEIKAIRRGAFAPVLQQPALQSLLVPFLSIGGVNLLDFLK